MITPELIGYIRGEFTKGRTREEIHQALIADGGWSEADLNEAFRTIIPMQGFAQNSLAPKIGSPSSSWSLWKILLAVVVLGALCFAIWFYRVPLISMWNSGVDKITELSTSYFGNKTNVNTDNTVVAPLDNTVVKNTVNSVIDCGVSTTPDLKNPLTYENNAVLTCLGNSALLCIDARAILKDDLFPNVFEIIKNGETCNFRLSYGEDSTLVDITGKKLALQYISCPLDIVKVVDESKKVTAFNAPNTDNLSKYASQIYFYGTLGLFMENNVDKNKIQSLGCGGPFIDSIIASYDKMQSAKK